jgi:3-hydroxyisobutyrate dehydrogenase-like beta-hydroxyacid dehydrogenase
MLPESQAILHGEAAANPSTRHGPEGLESAEALRGAAKRNMALTSMLPDGVAVNRVIIRNGVLPHLLQPAGTIAGFPLPSWVDCNSKMSPERGASQQQDCKDWGVAGWHTYSKCHIGMSG